QVIKDWESEPDDEWVKEWEQVIKDWNSETSDEWVKAWKRVIKDWESEPDDEWVKEWEQVIKDWESEPDDDFIDDPWMPLNNVETPGIPIVTGLKNDMELPPCYEQKNGEWVICD
ncbi:MAG: hypothetical protein JXA44_10250, partial [Methanospirillaceae archaeon]|nr:hypothetical protein [Methanospirillaceae archaeon]